MTIIDVSKLIRAYGESPRPGYHNETSAETPTRAYERKTQALRKQAT